MLRLNWENVLASFEKGGLNIESLKAFNLALLQKWRWRLVNNPDSLWARVIVAIHSVEAGIDLKGCKCSGVWASIISTYSMLHQRNLLSMSALSLKVSNGLSIWFWKDPWNGNGTLMSRFYRVYLIDEYMGCFVTPQPDKGRSIILW